MFFLIVISDETSCSNETKRRFKTAMNGSKKIQLFSNIAISSMFKVKSYLLCDFLLLFVDIDQNDFRYSPIQHLTRFDDRTRSNTVSKVTQVPRKNDQVSSPLSETIYYSFFTRK